MLIHPVRTSVLWLAAAGSLGVGQVPSLPALKTRSTADRSIVLDIVSGRTDASRSLVAGDFIVTDNGRSVREENLAILPTSEDGETQLLFVIDAINSSPQDVSRSAEAVERFVRSGSGALARLTTVLIVADRQSQLPDRAKQPGDTAVLQPRELFVHRIPATRDGNALARALGGYRTGLPRILDAQGGDAASERVRLSLEALSFIARAEANEPGAKVTIWLSPGWPFLARSEAKSSQQLFNSVIYFSDLLRTARMILSSVSPEGITNQDSSAQREGFLLSSRPGAVQSVGHAPNVPLEVARDYYKEFLKGVRTADDASGNDLSLQVLAYQSGGLVLQQNNDLQTMISRCVAEVSRVVSLAYRPQQVGATVAYHEIKVRMVHGSESLRTRTGFYTR